MKKISWFSPGNLDSSGVPWYSQGYSNAAIGTINALRDKEIAVFYNRNEIPFHINFYYIQSSLVSCDPIVYHLKCFEIGLN